MTMTLPPSVRPAPDRPEARRPDDIDPREAEVTWVDAAPFRGLLRQLMDETDLPAPVLAAAIGIPAGTARSLVSPTRSARRIRWVDAHALLQCDYVVLKREIHRLGDTSAARAALEATCSGLTAAQLARLLRTDTWIAAGLQEGWLTQCEQIVLWRALALAEGWTTTRAALADDPAAASERLTAGI